MNEEVVATAVQNAASGTMLGFGNALMDAILGYLVVFIGLTLLMFVVIIAGKICSDPLKALIVRSPDSIYLKTYSLLELAQLASDLSLKKIKSFLKIIISRLCYIIPYLLKMLLIGDLDRFYLFPELIAAVFQHLALPAH